MGTPAYDRDDGSNKMVTASHIFFNSGQDGDFVRQPEESYSSWGEVDETQMDFDHSYESGGLFDAAVCNGYTNRPTEGCAYALASDNGDGYGPEIVGTIAGDIIKYYEDDDGVDMYKRGRTTGVTVGTVTTVYDTYFETNAYHNDGDSGCPHYVYKKNRDGEVQAYICGIHRGDSSGKAQATKMAEIESRYNLTI